MEIEVEVFGSLKGVQRSEGGEDGNHVQAGEDGNQVPPEMGSLVEIMIFLKDTLKVTGEEDRVIMSQCCWEKASITMYSSQVDDMDYVKQVAYKTLHENMQMNPLAAEPAAPEVADTIRNLVQSTKETGSSPTLSLEIHVVCSIEKAGEGPLGLVGGHGYARFMKRLDDEVCGICHTEFSLPEDIIVTACHHPYHDACLSRWLFQGSYTCPLCRADVPSEVASPIELHYR
ncbi:hypothetical protein EJ110_NYTH52992 [Nymphaea thermarum]|nr:hypothetical protein EJ110_NYTH52992 [Nymphaea thermarum]